MLQPDDGSDLHNYAGYRDALRCRQLGDLFLKIMPCTSCLFAQGVANRDDDRLADDG
jgi:hypothetical protein